MSKNSGYIVEYIKDGQTQKGIVRHSEQHPSIVMAKKALVRLVNDNHTPKKDESGKEITVLKNFELLTVKGFVD